MGTNHKLLIKKALFLKYLEWNRLSMVLLHLQYYSMSYIPTNSEKLIEDEAAKKIMLIPYEIKRFILTVLGSRINTTARKVVLKIWACLKLKKQQKKNTATRNNEGVDARHEHCSMYPHTDSSRPYSRIRLFWNIL